ncbi:MAG: c-type cytochrome [Gemmatimonadales bacterium]
MPAIPLLRSVAIVPVAVLSFVVPTAMAQQRDSIPPHPPAPAAGGVYSDSQAVVGERVYRDECSRCHLIADQNGPDFQANWSGRTVRELFDYLRSTMPDDDPGALTDDQYLVATAYILKLNGMPSGPAPLSSDTTALNGVKIGTASAP